AREIETEAAHRERAALLTEVARARVIDTLEGFRNHKGEKDIVRAWRAMHENLGNEIGTFVQDAESRREVIFRSAQREMRDVMREFRRGAITGDLRRTSKLVGNRKVQARMDNFLAELFDQNTGDATAKAMADAWKKVSEDLRVRFNAGGGAVGKLQRWGMPQSHDPLAMTRVGKEVWVRSLMEPNVLDRNRMRHAVTGERLSNSELRASLEVMYDHIVADGWSEKDVSAQPRGRGALYTRHADHRYLHFKDAAAWRQYAERFGNPDLFGTMMAYVAVMSRDIAHMETFGPNPNLLRRYMRNWIEAQAAQQDIGTAVAAEGLQGRKLQTHVRKGLERAEAMWDLMRGKEVVSLEMAEAMQSTRNVITASSLGSAWLSSLSDAGFGKDMRNRLGMGMVKANVGRVVVTSLRELVTMGNREDAIAAGLGLDAAMNVLRRKGREAAGIDHRFWTGFLADRTLTWSLLTPWTQAGKTMAGMDVMRFIGRLSGHGFDTLPKGLQRALGNHGFDAAAWEQLRATPLRDGLLRPADLLDQASGQVTPELQRARRELGERYLQMILRETRSAVPEATVESRSIVFHGGKPGTLLGEAARSVGQFKGFGLAVIMIHLGRLARQMGAGDTRNTLLHGGSLMITLTILGAIAMALKDVKDGRDPRRWLDERTWLDPSHWGAAFMQAGGLGIYGDLLFADVSRHGHGLESTLAGPLVGRVSDIGDVVIGEPLRALTGKKTRLAAKALKVVKSNTPVLNHWALTLAYQRTVLDQLLKLSDPEAQAAFNRTVRQRQRDYGQEYWWRPGERAPHRAPNVGAAFR
ncbi:MAG: hypothetical protein ABS54_10040, partial [Hyphomicrobium sp. SCN 65-11]